MWTSPDVLIASSHGRNSCGELTWEKKNWGGESQMRTEGRQVKYVTPLWDCYLTTEHYLPSYGSRESQRKKADICPPSWIPCTDPYQLVSQPLLEYLQGQDTHYHLREFLSALESSAVLKDKVNIPPFPSHSALGLEFSSLWGWGMDRGVCTCRVVNLKLRQFSETWMLRSLSTPQHMPMDWHCVCLSKLGCLNKNTSDRVA